MKKQLGLICIILGLLVGCTATNNSDVEGAHFPQKMNALKESVITMTPLVYDQKAFLDSKNEVKILKELKRFQKNAHRVDDKLVTKVLGNDPLAISYAKGLRSDLKRAEEVFIDGHKSYARTVLKGALNYCIQCHTKSSFGPNFNWMKKEFANLKVKTPVKIDLLVATRQYDKALKMLEKELLKDGSQILHIYSFEKNLENYLAVSVRVKKDPKAVLKLLNSILFSKDMPYFLKNKVNLWKRSILSWVSKGYRLNTWKQAKRFFNKQRKTSKGYGQSYSDVENLFLSAFLHDQLIVEKNAKKRAEVYWMLGETYDSLVNFGFWEAPEVYYEACVKSNPKTQQSMKCFHKFEEVIHLGYTGSGGTFLPQVERERINSLRALAKP